MALKISSPADARPAATSSFPKFDEITKPRRRSRCSKSARGPVAATTTAGMTSRHIGGGHKQKYRVIDFKRKKHGVAAEVVGIEYDPIRTARIALLQYKDGEKTYILAPDGLKVGAKSVSGPDAAPELGNALPLKNIPLGTSDP